MSETTTKRPRAGKIVILRLTEPGTFLVSTESYASRRLAQEALKKIGVPASYAIAAMLWQGEVTVETKTVATLKTAGAEPKKTRTRKPSVHARVAAILDSAAAQARTAPPVTEPEPATSGAPA